MKRRLLFICFKNSFERWNSIADRRVYVRWSSYLTHFRHWGTKTHPHQSYSCWFNEMCLPVHRIGWRRSTEDNQILSVAQVRPASCLAGEKVSDAIMQGAAQVMGLVGLQPAVAETLNSIQDFLFGFVSIEKEFDPDILTILRQAQTIGGRSEVQLVDQSGENGPDLLELCWRHTAVHQEENVSEPFCQSWKKTNPKEQ